MVQLKAGPVGSWQAGQPVCNPKGFPYNRGSHKAVSQKSGDFCKLRKKSRCGNRCDPLRAASDKADQPASQLASKHCEQKKTAEQATARPICINRYMNARWFKSQPALLGQARPGSSNDKLLVGTSGQETKFPNARESIETSNLPQRLKIEISKARHQLFFLP